MTPSLADITPLRPRVWLHFECNLSLTDYDGRLKLLSLTLVPEAARYSVLAKASLMRGPQGNLNRPGGKPSFTKQNPR
jgi:hypothetical protein